MTPDLAGRIGAAKSLLFVPGDRPERFDKAARSGADVVILDLEDAVGTAQKDPARQAVADWVRTTERAQTPVAVRVNAVGTRWHEADMASLAGQQVAVMLPMATADSAARLGSGRHPVLALIETAAGVITSSQIAATPGVARLAIGTFDLAAELGVAPDDRDAMVAARGALVLASAAAQIPPPVDGVTAAVDDRAVLESDLAYAARVGFTGKLCIHPRQVETVSATLRPTADQVAWATRVLRASRDSSVSVVDGQMVDRPVLERARRLLHAAGEPA